MWRAVAVFVVLLAVLLSLLSGATVSLLNALAPRAGVKRYEGISYGEGPRHVLDVYAPAPKDGASTQAAPVVVFFYGGGWVSGSRGIYRFLGAALAARGMVVVVPDYRLHPEVEFPGFVQDGAVAVAWTAAHIAEFGGDSRNIFLMGHSAGAEIAALLALDPEYLQAVNLSPEIFAGFIGLAGPYDFLPLTDPVNKVIFGPESQQARSQPINYVSRDAPPMFLCTGRDDHVVRPRNSYRLTDRLKALGRPVTLRVYSYVGHLTLVGAFATELAFLAPVRSDVLAFIAQYSRRGSPAVAGHLPDP
jgi:acetyl esterase/lipase